MNEPTQTQYAFSVKNRSRATKLAKLLLGPTARGPQQDFAQHLKIPALNYIMGADSPAEMFRRYKQVSLHADVREFSPTVATAIKERWPQFASGIDGGSNEQDE